MLHRTWHTPKNIIDKQTANVILTADFKPQSATWDVYPSRTKPKQKGPIQHLANNAYRIETKKELIGFYHKATGHLVKKTWIPAIEHGPYASWPGLTVKLVQRFLDKQEATIMGHMHTRKSRVQSTKPKIAKLPTGTTTDEEENELLDQEKPPRPSILLDRKERVGAHVVEFSALKWYIATDLCVGDIQQCPVGEWSTYLYFMTMIAMPS